LLVTAALTALARRALDLVPDGARLGLGSGHAAEAFLDALAEGVRGGLRVSGVPTSEATARRARDLGIALDTLDDAAPLDLTIDGADEVEGGTLNLIKGWGGALVRERIVAAASRRQVILVTREKLVGRLGARGRLPIEVLPFAAPFCLRRIEHLAAFGLHPQVRTELGRTFVTDNGNWILDCALPPQDDPAGLERALRAIPGVIDTGLFLGTADLVLVADDEGVQEWHRSGGVAQSGS
jgi:ribose 5-phosphate isomerase A